MGIIKEEGDANGLCYNTQLVVKIGIIILQVNIHNSEKLDDSLEQCGCPDIIQMEIRLPRIPDVTERHLLVNIKIIIFV